MASTNYQLFENDNEQKDIYLDGSENSKSKHQRSFTISEKFLIIISVSIVIACTVINISLYRSSPSKLTPSSSSSSLPHIHSYAGLSDLKLRLNKSYESFLYIKTYPHILTQISSSNPDRIIHPDDPAKHLNPAFGTVSPDTGRFHVEYLSEGVKGKGKGRGRGKGGSGITTIAQFRIVDFEMQKCYLELDLTELRIKNTNWAWPTPVLNVWKLSNIPSDRFLDVNTLSWNTIHPHSRKEEEEEELVVSWNITSDEKVFTSESFDCPWDSHPAFEFECQKIGCLIDFWNSPSENSPGTQS